MKQYKSRTLYRSCARIQGGDLEGRYDAGQPRAPFVNTHLQLSSASPLDLGTLGCNTLRGGYLLKLNSLPLFLD